MCTAAPDYTNSNRVWYRQCRYGGGFCDGFNCPGYTAAERGGYCTADGLADAVDDLANELADLRDCIEQFIDARLDGDA